MPPIVLHLCRIVTALALVGMPAAAWADAPRDMATNLRLWLDGQDINGTDTGNGGGTRPAVGSTVSTWKDKSANQFSAASFGTARPTVTSDSVSCTNTGGFWITSGIYPVGTAVTASDVFAVVNARTDIWSHLIWQGAGGSRIAIDIPYAGNIYWDQTPANGRLSTSWSGSGSAFNTTYLWNFSIGGGNQSIFRNGASIASQSSTTGSYTPLAGQNFAVCGGEGGGYDGTVSELLVFSRRLATAEKNILQSYLAAKYANPGGAGTASKYTAPGNFRYHVGGIGQESDGSLATGTSAGLTITNGNFLANGRYLVAGTDSLNPATGATTADAPNTFTRRSSRVWYVQRTGTGGSPGTVNMTFNLTQMNMAPASGVTLALATRSGTTGQFTTIATSTYSGNGTVTFSVTNPSTAYYAVGASLPGPPVIAASLGSQVLSDTVRTSNFKAIPGALVRTDTLVTNSGETSVDPDTMQLTFPIPAGMKFYLGDIGTAGGGPVNLTQGSTSSGLTYTYTSLASTTDGLDFSNNSGTSWTYTPVPDAQQTDSAITHIRVRPKGIFTLGVSPNFPSFTITYGLIVK